jgi:hypothetical protein
MFGPLSSRLQLPAAILGALGAGTLALLVLTAPAHAASLQAQMQEQADRAALTGANVLGTGGANSQQAIEATQQALAAIPGVTKEVTASVADLAVTVKLSFNAFDVVSTARYVAPDQSADWAWASRQHFAANRAPVMLGSNCGRTCGFGRMR